MECRRPARVRVVASIGEQEVSIKQELESLKKWIGEKKTAIDYVTVPTIHRLSALIDRDGAYPNVKPPSPQAAPAPADDNKTLKP